MSLALKYLLIEHGISQRAAATACSTSVATINRLVSRAEWPGNPETALHLRAAIESFLTARGLPAIDAFKKALPRTNATGPVAPAELPELSHHNEDITMLLRRHTLTQAARQHFELPADPFDDIQEAADVFISGDIRYVRDAMFGTAMRGGFMAVIGESGAGKSTLREELVDRLQREQRNVLVIEPFVLAMEDRDSKGKTLKSQHIAEAIMATIAPLARAKISPEARFRQLKETLVESCRAGMRHVLIIEEAHALPIPTLKHLKRFIELKDGLKKLLGIVLLGQPELAQKLAEQNPEVREVVQRIEIVTLAPLDNDLDAYLKHRFERAGVPVARVLDRAAVDALRAKLGAQKGRGMSLLYPLVVHNVLARAMNIAAEIAAPRVTPDCIKGV